MNEEQFILDRKSKLEEAKLRIEKELGVLTKKKGKGRQAIFPDIGDKEDESAQEVEIYESSLSIERNLEEMLNKINKALDRMKAGIYLKCEKCGQDIVKERLRVYPEATVCVKCLKK